MDWWPYVGFRVALGDQMVGFYTNRTRRDSPQDREPEATTDLYFSRPAFPPGALEDSLQRMYLTQYYYWDCATYTLGTTPSYTPFFHFKMAQLI